jgi:hypothetical protein
MYRILTRVQDALPIRGVPNRRVTPLSARRETQRRAAMAVLSLVVVVGALGIGYAMLGGLKTPGTAIQTLDSAQGAMELARANLNRVIGPGIDLVQNDPRRAEQLLTEAYDALKRAATAGVAASTVNPIRTQVVAALDRLYGMVDVASSPLFTFPDDPVVDLRAIVKGPDGAPFVLDAATKTVYRIDVAGKKATAIFREGNKAAGATQGVPKLLTVGGRDLLMVDSKNVLWRWRPADTNGKGTITRVRVTGATEWGDDIVGIGTFLRNADANLYNFYVVDPSAEQLLRYSPAADGSGYPGQPNQVLSSQRDVSAITSMYIDGDIWLADNGEVLRLVGGNSAGWTAATPGDAILRGSPKYAYLTSGADRRTGTIYAFDAANDRAVGLSKVNGAFVAQYRLGGSASGWGDLRGWYVEPGLDSEPDAIVWISAKGIQRALLQPTGGLPGASVAPTATGGAGSPEASR